MEGEFKPVSILKKSRHRSSKRELLDNQEEPLDDSRGVTFVEKKGSLDLDHAPTPGTCLFFIFERLLLFSELGSERNRKIGFFAHLIYDRKSGRQRTPKVGGDGCTTVKQPLHQGKHIKEEASIPCNGIIEVRYWLQASAEKPLLDLKSIRIIEE